MLIASAGLEAPFSFEDFGFCTVGTERDKQGHFPSMRKFKLRINISLYSAVAPIYLFKQEFP